MITTLSSKRSSFAMSRPSLQMFRTRSIAAPARCQRDPPAAKERRCLSGQNASFIALGMDEATFWALVDGARSEATPALSNQAEILQRALQSLPPPEIALFDRIFRQLHNDAYRWDLWAAAYIIEGGCSDDGFENFRAGLIGLGRDVYEAALKDPGSLVRLPTRGIDFSNEEMLYAASSAYEAVTGEQLPDDGLIPPAVPIGEPWDEDAVGEEYPELAAKFGFG
jgi:hypothetical protein